MAAPQAAAHEGPPPGAPGSGRTRRQVLSSALALSGVVAARGLFWPRRAGAVTRFEPLDLDEFDERELEAEVCVIGSGPAGAILATNLVERGIETLVIESGPSDWRAGNVCSPLDAYRSRGEIDYPVATTRFRGAGGTSCIWSGNCPRMFPIDFEPNAYTPAGAAWPIRYSDLEPYYLLAERELRVNGAANTPASPPRQQPFPMPSSYRVPNLVHLLEEARSGIAFQIPPRSEDGAGLPLNVAETHLPRLRASAHGRLVCSATVTSIVTDEAGRVSAIRLQSPAGGVRLARATHYVVACGGIESARLLLLSRGPRFPRGLGNDTDMVGRYFTEHVTSVRAYGNVGGLWDPRSRHERAVSDDYYVEAKQAGFGGLRLTFVSTRAAIDPQWRHPWESLERGVRALRVLELRLSIDQEMEPVADNQVALDNGVRDLFGNPGAALSLRATERDRATARHAEQLIAGLMRELGAEDVRLTTSVVGWNHHHMGTCRMGDDPRTSVVDRDLRVHACENLYVAGSAPFVTTGASNPTLTIVALSLRLADHLAERLRPGALPANSHDLSLRHPGESRDPGRTPPGSRLSPG